MSSLEIWGCEVLVSERDGETDGVEFVAVEGAGSVDHCFSVTFIAGRLSNTFRGPGEGAGTQNMIANR